MEGHTGLVILFRHGAALSVSLKRNINTMSSTETETVAISDGMKKNMWVLYFTRAEVKEKKDKIFE